MSEGRRERADAVRNRRAILRATEELLAGHRPEQISMEQIAAAAGVGKGTVFHRFGSRMGLMLALMQERALDLDEAVRSGPPPLGPGAPARERLFAFLDAVVEVVGRNKSLLAELGHAGTTTQPSGEAPPTAHPVYLGWHAHLSALLAELRPDLDAELIAHLLLGSLQSAPILRLLEQGEGRRIAATLRELAESLVDR
ncbi:TetR/AcrR family transcriptional regulator [Streptomyces sp. FH025]|uniref:TetR/AcrR family transcriptional regulator n=1 Tax=Streptomyces sp. FH025 TaxID=2815937 RepID=UPI001A9E6179|nr:TetR/AcrR family transcriptional regulator [Streptomyces sp. FH025]MBO1417929.1 TetR/AcrR family transcriptional regulator [Streptomyces sp. FH025]